MSTTRITVTLTTPTEGTVLIQHDGTDTTGTIRNDAKLDNAPGTGWSAKNADGHTVATGKRGATNAAKALARTLGITGPLHVETDEAHKRTPKTPPAPRPGTTPDVTSVIQLLKGAGFQHSRYTESRHQAQGSGFYAEAGTNGGVRVRFREGDHDFFQRMSEGGYTDVTDVPKSPLAQTRAAEYAEVLGARYAVHNDGTTVHVSARDQLPPRPKNLPTPSTVRAALTAALPPAGIRERYRVVQQPDHTLVALADDDVLAEVTEALTAECWTFTVSETSQSYHIKITGATPGRAARVRALRAARNAQQPTTPAAPEPQPETPEPTPSADLRKGDRVANIHTGQEGTWGGRSPLGGWTVNDSGAPLNFPYGEDHWRLVERAPAQEPTPAPAAPATPPPGIHDPDTGRRYAVGTPVTWHGGGFWDHGEVTGIDTEARTVTVRFTSQQVAPAPRRTPGATSKPGKLRQTEPRESVVAVNKNLSYRKEK
ncbi:hypothetical protein [Streptomyces albidoflavus]|uniref:hypothetical protein n=1 Tax=Streptomyces albidoflavus TaxID=1886 RepID=UPI0034099C36